MTSVVMTGRSIKGCDRFIIVPARASALVVRRMLDAAAAAGHLTLVGGGARMLLDAGYTDLGAGYDAQLTVGDNLVAFLQIARDRVIDAVVEQNLYRHLFGDAVHDRVDELAIRSGID